MFAWLMDGGQPKASFVIPQMDGKTVLGAGDYNEGGNSDFLWRDPATGVVNILSMQQFITPAIKSDDFLVV